jgi:hypothetical protein
MDDILLSVWLWSVSVDDPIKRDRMVYVVELIELFKEPVLPVCGCAREGYGCIETVTETFELCGWRSILSQAM